ncbi:MAG: 4Fe-4S binding protein [Dehalococcoidia bacterium]|nr:4Fe-4S binding protein [Dehalococcoidia bacterium]
MADLTWKEIETGNIVSQPGNAKSYRTGDWRSERPIRDQSKCNKCGLCWIYCPEAAIHPIEDGLFETNLFFCKGCGICMVECPKQVIKMVEEEE